MIRSETEIIVKFSQYILEGFATAFPDLKLGYGVPEEEVLQSERPLPYLSLFFLYDRLYEPNRLMGTYLERVELPDGNTKFIERDAPEPVQFFFQLDMYSHSQKNLLQLGTELSKVIKRRGSYFLDSDGAAVDILQADVTDLSRDIFRLGNTEERVFRRSYTYSLACQYKPDLEPLEEYGIILQTDITVKDFKEFIKDYPPQGEDNG